MATPIPPFENVPAETRPLRSVRSEDQLGFDETVVEDAELEQALEERYTAKVDAGAARKAYDLKAEAATAKITALDLEDGTAVRCGRFRITRTAIGERSVAFETKASSRITIKFLGDD